MRRMRPLQQHVIEQQRTPARDDKTKNLASWTCGGIEMHWHSKDFKLYTDAIAPHGAAPSDPDAVLQILSGCKCQSGMAESKKDAISALRRLGGHEIQRMYGRGTPMPGSPRSEQHEWIEFWRRQVDVRARCAHRIHELVGRRLTDMCAEKSVCSVWRQGDQVILALDHGAVQQPFEIRPPWLAQVVGTGLHDALGSKLILRAERSGFLARCLAVRYERNQHQVPGSIYFADDRRFIVEHLECCRVDGRWMEQSHRDIWEVDPMVDPPWAYVKRSTA